MFALKVFASALFSLSAAIFAKADFPGDTFALTYNTTSSSVPTTGYLELCPAPDGSYYYAALTSTPSTFSAHFTFDGPYGTLNMVCPTPNLIAVLTPPTEPIDGFTHLLTWWDSTGSEFPSGSQADDLQLGPSPTYDTLVTINLGSGSWKAASVGNPPQYVVGWSEDTSNDGIPLTLVKGNAFGSC